MEIQTYQALDKTLLIVEVGGQPRRCHPHRAVLEVVIKFSKLFRGRMVVGVVE